MEAAAELAGYYAAHAVCTLAEHDTFSPILGLGKAGGKREMQRLMAPDAALAVKFGQKRLAEPPEGTERAALLFDGRIELDDGEKCDAIVIEVVVYGAAPSRMTMMIPYRNSASEDGFAVHQPKFSDYKGPKIDRGAVADAFFRGVDSHEEGGAIWNDHLDPSR